MNIEQMIYDWVVENFGESEACNPSWNITELAKYIEDGLKSGNYKAKYKEVENG